MKLDATQAAAIKLSHLIEPGRTVYSTDGRAYRVLSKIASGGSLSFRLANLQGQPVPTPADFSPIDGARMRFASFLKFAFNKDITTIVNEMITQAGLPTDPKMDWAAYLTKTYSANLRSVTTDPDIQDEVIYRTVVYLLFERKNKNGKKVLENFAEKLKNFDVKTQKKPLAEQVSDYLKGTFLYYARDHAKHDAIALMRPEEMSMEQPGEEGETYNILDTEEHATAPGVGQGEADRDIDQFITQFQEWVKTKETPKSAPNYAALLKIYWDQAQQSDRGDVKISDLTQEWIRRTGLSFDSLKQYRDKLGSLIRDFVYENKAQLGNSYKLVDLLQHMFPPPKAKARPAKASSAKPKCPHCGSNDYGLMPTDFETAKCNKCGKNWEHGIVEGINDPKEAADETIPFNLPKVVDNTNWSKEDYEKDRLEADVSRFSKELKKFPKGPTGMTPDSTKATPEWQAAKRNYNQAFQALREFNSKHTAAVPYCDGCDRVKSACICEGCECSENKKAADGDVEKPTLQKLPSEGGFHPIAAGEVQYTAPGLQVVLAEDWFIYVADETTEHMWVYNTEMWYEWGEIPNAFGEDTTKPQPTVEAMIPYAKGHTPEPLMDDNKKQMTLQEFEASNGDGWTDPGFDKEGMLGHDFVNADQEAIRPSITPGDTGRVPHGRTQGSLKVADGLRFVVMQGSYPLEVHKENCRDMNMPKYRRAPKDWVITGNSVDEAVKQEADELNSQFDQPYETKDLFRVMPCCRKLVASSKWGEKLKKLEARRDPENKEAAESVGCGCVHCGTPHSACIGFKHKVGPCDCRAKFDQYDPAKRDWKLGEFFNRNRVKESAELAGRGGGEDDVRGAGDLWREEFYQGGGTAVAPKIATSVQVLPCCGSVTNHHKPDCKTYNENFNKTLTQLYPDKFKGDERVVSATKIAGKWKVLLRNSKGQQREQQVSGVDYSSAARAVRKYMKEGENVVSMTIASKKKTAAPAAAAPAPAPVAPPAPAPSANTVVAPPPGTAIALPGQQQTDDKPMRKTVPPELPGKKWHMTSKTASILEDAFQYFMEGKKEGGLADVFNETYTRTGKGEDKYMATSKLMMDYEYAFQRQEDGSLSDEDSLREDAENALREIVGDDPNYSESAAPAAKEVLKSEQNTPEVEAEVAQLAQTHPLTEIHENCNPAYEHGQWWIICGPCGASWSVVDAEGGQSYNGLDLEEVDAGDESCMERSHESSLDPKAVALTGRAVDASTDKKAWTDDDGEETLEVQDRLEYLRGELRAERISYEELAELQGLAEYIDPGDVELLEAAGVEEVIPQPDVPIETPEFGEADKTRLKGLGVIGKKKKAFEPDANSGIRGSNDGTFIYQADVWCEKCATEIAAELDAEGKTPADVTDERSYDSDNYPKGPFFDEESDSPEHCSGCKIFLENPLTTDGQTYMQSMVDEALAKGRSEEPHIKEWMDFYGYHPESADHEASDASDKINAMPQRGQPKSPNQLGLQPKSELDMYNERSLRTSSGDKEAAMDNKKAAIAQPTSGEDEGFNVKVVYNKYGITLEPTNNLLSDVQGIGESIPKPSIWELMEDFFTNGWEMVNPEDIGALTSGEIMSDQDGNVYWHERYQIEDMVEMLMNGEKVNLQYGGNLFEGDEAGEIAPPAEPDPNQMELGLQSSEKEATGEMSQAELDSNGREEWPMHYNIADALGAQVKPFDQYQGPYVRVPEGRLWVTTPEGAGDGAELIVWNESNRKSSEPFMWDDENAAVDAALSVMDNPPANTLPWGAEREEQLKNGPDTSEVEDTVPAEHPEGWTPEFTKGDKESLHGLGVKGSEKRAAPPVTGGRPANTEYDNHPLIEMLWDSLKRDPANKDRVQTAWGTKTKQGLVLSVARAMKESPVSGE